MSIPAKYLNRNIYLNILIKFDLVDISWELLEYILSLVEINYDMTYNMTVWQYHCLIYVFLWHHLSKMYPGCSPWYIHFCHTCTSTIPAMYMQPLYYIVLQLYASVARYAKNKNVNVVSKYKYNILTSSLLLPSFCLK